MKFELKQHFRIESARKLPRLPESHPCSRLHGHSFEIIVRLIGERNSVGWVMDYHEIEERLQPFLESLDHRVLNEIPGLENPTSENLALWLFEKASPLLHPYLRSITVKETPNTECTYPVTEEEK